MCEADALTTQELPMTDHHPVAEYNRGLVEEFRANGGRVGGQFEGAPLLLLTTTGAKSGLERVSPVMYMALDGSYAVFATFAGMPMNPAWYHNLLANPQASIEVGEQTIAVRARFAEGEEREEIWTAQKLAAPGMAEYELKTDRVMPVVILEPS
jgi:deazaflavin-dependent oxidoreductase (nitroreductase family)